MDQMRRSDRQMSVEKAAALLTKGEYGILNTQGEDGYPYGVPVSYVYKDGFLYFHSAREGKKLRNIGFHEKVSFVVVGETCVQGEQFTTAYESVMAFGIAKEITEIEDKVKGLMLLVEKYSPGFEIPGEAYARRAVDQTKVFQMTIEHMTGKERP